MGNESPYDNPYLPSFVRQWPRVHDTNNLRQISSSMLNYGQIRPVSGFSGAREYATTELAAGASCIVVDSDPNLARIYMTAKDTNNQILISGFDLVPIEEPKPITMESIDSKLNGLLDRLTKLEEKSANDKPVFKSGNYTTPATVEKSGANVTTKSGDKQSKFQPGNGAD